MLTTYRHLKWICCMKSWVPKEGQPRWLIFTKKKFMSLNLYICTIYTPQPWLTSEKSGLNDFWGDLVLYSILWVVDDKWILSVSLLENIICDAQNGNIFQVVLRMFWPGDRLRRWYSGCPHITKENLGTSLSYNLEEPNWCEKESSVSKIILSRISLNCEFS